MTAALIGGAMGPLAARADSQRVRVLATTDRAVVEPLIADFERLHPGLQVDYVQLGSVELSQRFLAEGRADVLWSSAMDLQIKLVNDGHAVRHDSVHADRLPRWAMWKREAYATNCEPVGVAFHRDLWDADELPRTHRALAERLRAEAPRLRGRVATYDIEHAGLGYLLATHDAMATSSAWELVRALAACQASLHTDTQGMLDSVAQGRALLAYNVLGTYVEAAARHEPRLAVLYPSDYTLIASRVAFVARDAPNPEGARAWLDHVLSLRGQRVLATECGLYAVHADVRLPLSASGLLQRLGPAARPIGIGPGLLAHIDESKRKAFIARWRQLFRAAA